MKRLSVGGDGLLRERDGTVVGRLVSMSVEWGTIGGIDPSTKVESPPDAVGRTNADGGVGEGTPISRVWAHYQSVIPFASRQTLDSTRTTIIRKALAVRSEDDCNRAIDGLAVSPHHNGQNDRKKKYLGLRYALAGIGRESTDERIDKMAALADPTVDGVLAGIPSAVREMVRHRQRQVEDMLLHPGDVNRRARGQGSERYLRETWGLRAFAGDGGRVEWVREVGGGA